MSPIFSNNYPGNLYQQIFINTNFMINMMYTAASVFMHKDTKAKFKFLGEDFQSYLIEIAGKDNLPQAYGGEAPNIFWTI